MSSVERHHTQNAGGEVGERLASVLLAKTPEELEQAYDKWATKYDEDLGDISGLGSQWGLAAAKVVERNCNTKEYPKLLDFGCGTGSSGPYLKSLGWNGEMSTVLDGCDLSQGMMSVAKKLNCYRKLIKSSFQSSGADVEAYDIVHASGVFAPGQAPPSTFDEILRVLRVGGMAIFTVRKSYYDGPEGAGHKAHLEELCVNKSWKLISQTEEEYLPKEGQSCYVFCLKKL